MSNPSPLKSPHFIMLVACVCFTLGYGSNEWLASNDIAKGIAEHKAKEETLTYASKDGIPEYARVFSTEASFEDAKEDLLESIASKGLVVSYTSHAKTMLDNTAAVSGVTQLIYENAEILSFCKADLSHDLVGANPHNIVLCPYNISIYTLSGDPEKVYFSFRKGEAAETKTKPIDALLVEIIEDVL